MGWAVHHALERSRAVQAFCCPERLCAECCAVQSGAQDSGAACLQQRCRWDWRHVKGTGFFAGGVTRIEGALLFDQLLVPPTSGAAGGQARHCLVTLASRDRQRMWPGVGWAGRGIDVGEGGSGVGVLWEASAAEGIAACQPGRPGGWECQAGRQLGPGTRQAACHSIEAGHSRLGLVQPQWGLTLGLLLSVVGCQATRHLSRRRNARRNLDPPFDLWGGGGTATGAARGSPAVCQLAQCPRPASGGLRALPKQPRARFTL